jgi:hypothetical protein
VSTDLRVFASENGCDTDIGRTEINSSHDTASALVVVGDTWKSNGVAVNQVGNVLITAGNKESKICGLQSYYQLPAFLLSKCLFL